MVKMLLAVIAAAWLVQPSSALVSQVLQIHIEKYKWDPNSSVVEVMDMKALMKGFLPDLSQLLKSAQNGFAHPGCYGNDTCAQALMVSELAQQEKQRAYQQQVDEHRMKMDEMNAEIDANVQKVKAEQAKTEGIKQETERLQQEVALEKVRAEQRRAEAQRRLEEEQRRFRFRAAGDPILCPERNGTILEEQCVNYTGPAAAVCFDKSGLRAIHYVGVCDEDGSNHMGGDAYWVCEVRTAIIKNGVLQWKFRNATKTHQALVTCDDTWQSEASDEDAMPSGAWLQHFEKGKSFVLHDAQPRIMRGPKAGQITSMLFDPEQLWNVKSKIRTARMEEHLEAMLVLQGFAQEHEINKRSVQLLMLDTLRYGLAMLIKG